jgi:gamma-glutamylcyclotransferase (GGCT)/AIG2-like uncharacterized protein YtfP
MFLQSNYRSLKTEKKMPNKKIKPPKTEKLKAKNNKWSLVVNGEIKLTAGDIFEYRLFDAGKKIAVIYEENKKIKFAVFHLDEKVSAYIDLKPQPSPGYAIIIEGHYANANIAVHFRSRNKFYILHSGTMIIKGPFNEKTANELVGPI